MPLYAIADQQPCVPDDSWVAPSADLIGNVHLGHDVSIWFGAVIRADNTPILIGDRTNVQEGVVMHSDPGQPLQVGTGCTIGHRAVLHGCTIGNNVLIGMGAIVLNGAVIGDNCLIGAGALVTEGKTFLAGSLIMGAPARIARALPFEAINGLYASANGYVSKQRDYAAALRQIGP